MHKAFFRFETETENHDFIDNKRHLLTGRRSQIAECQAK